MNQWQLDQACRRDEKEKDQTRTQELLQERKVLEEEIDICEQAQIEMDKNFPIGKFDKWGLR